MNDALMNDAVEAAAGARIVAHPNPWVGCAIRTPNGRTLTGATHAPGGAHAEIDALAAAGPDAAGSTVAVTLEPCCVTGRTGPCTEALVDAGVRRVVIAVLDPDPRVSGRGVAALERAGVEVTVGVGADRVERQLAPYLHQRRTGRPYVILKLAAALDGATAAPDGSSRWITGRAARADAHRLRAESDVIVVGAGTVRADDPSLTTRHVEGPDPARVVLGTAPAGARIQPCREWHDEPARLLDTLGAEGAVQVLVEGGAHVAGDWHRRGLVDRYVFYLAPVLFGGDDATGMFRGPGAPTIAAVTRGRIDDVRHVGEDLRIDVVPGPDGATTGRDEIAF